MSDKQQDPEVAQTFDLTKLEPGHHELVQRGPFLCCLTPGHSHGTRKIPVGKMLSQNQEGKYVLIDE